MEECAGYGTFLRGKGFDQLKWWACLDASLLFGALYTLFAVLTDTRAHALKAY